MTFTCPAAQGRLSLSGPTKVMSGYEFWFPRFSHAKAIVTEVFEDACRYIRGHSQPLPSLDVTPTLDLLESDWSRLQACREAFLQAVE